LGLAIASLLFSFSPFITFLTANSTILPLLVLGISGTFKIIDGTCLGEQFFLIRDLINLIFSPSNSLFSFDFFRVASLAFFKSYSSFNFC